MTYIEAIDLLALDATARIGEGVGAFIDWQKMGQAVAEAKQVIFDHAWVAPE